MQKIAKSGKTKTRSPQKREAHLKTGDSYNSFLKSVQLFALGMNSIEAHLDREAYSNAHSDKDVKINKTIETSFELTDYVEVSFDVGGTFTLTMTNGTDEPFLRVLLRYEAHFHFADAKPLREQAERFAEGEARLIFWPYFRQAVSDVTARMYIRQVTVPLTLRF